MHLSVAGTFCESRETNVECEFSGHTDEEWWSDPRLKRVDVVVCTATCTLGGSAYRLPHQRLLDAITSGFVANSYRLGKDFIPLTDVLAYFPNGGKERAVSAQISKSSVLFVAERSGGRPERTGVTAYQLRMKKSVAARVYLPPYMLMGNMYPGSHQKLLHLLEGDEVFLAMTNVGISPPLPTGESAFSFVAINRRQIVHVIESVIGPHKPLGDTEAALRTKNKVAR
jgi:hypothetical protein